jgi:hypothetical protein
MISSSTKVKRLTLELEEAMLEAYGGEAKAQWLEARKRRRAR